MAITGPGQLPAPIQQTFTERLLAVRQPNLIYKTAALLDRMPVHGGKIKRYRRYNKLDHAIVPLGTSGQDPDAQVSTAIDIDAELSWYGTYVNIHEQVVIQNQDPKRYGVVKLLLIDLEAEVAFS